MPIILHSKVLYQFYTPVQNIMRYDERIEYNQLKYILLSLLDTFVITMSNHDETPSSASTGADNGSMSASDSHPEFKVWEDVSEISPDLLRGIYAYGFEKPSNIQQKSIMSIIHRRDVIAQAQSGTGKTGAFTVAALQSVDISKASTQILILAPTRELARQIYDVILGLSAMMSGLHIRLLVGGTSTSEDAAELRKSVPHIIVGCPGRVFDMIRRNHIQSSHIHMLVLDEADEMLSAGFNDQIYNIFQYMPSEIQVVLFSATMPTELYNLTEKFMRNPVNIQVKAEQLTLEGIQQHYVALDDDVQKYLTLKDLFKTISVSQCIIFCNSTKRVADLHEAMLFDGFPVCCIHSGMEKGDNRDREKAYQEFKAGLHRVLISSNVTARGIDIQQVSTVINFDMPQDVHIYLHRIGRSGRWGRKGVAINFITRRDMRIKKEIESYYDTSITELPVNFMEGI
jgi:translation initiation factor 4A